MPEMLKIYDGEAEDGREAGRVGEGVGGGVGGREAQRTPCLSPSRLAQSSSRSSSRRLDKEEGSLNVNAALHQRQQEDPPQQQLLLRFGGGDEEPEQDDIEGSSPALVGGGEREDTPDLSSAPLPRTRTAGKRGQPVAGSPNPREDRQVLRRTDHETHVCELTTGSESDVSSGNADQHVRGEKAGVGQRAVSRQSAFSKNVPVAHAGTRKPSGNNASLSAKGRSRCGQIKAPADKSCGNSAMLVATGSIGFPAKNCVAASQAQVDSSFSFPSRTPSASRPAGLTSVGGHKHGTPQRPSACSPAVQDHQLRRERHISMDSFDQHLSADLEEPTLDDERLRAKLDELGNLLDHDAAALGENLDKWIGLMRRAVMADFLESKTLIMRRHSRLLAESREEYRRDTEGVKQELAGTTKLLQSAELTMRNRGVTILRCADRLQNKRAVLLASGLLSRWRLAYAHRQYERFCLRLSGRQHRRSLLRKTMHAWKADVGNTWRKITERNIRATAEKQMQSLAMEYEKKIAELSGQLNHATKVIRESQTARANYEDTMKKAFLRGVCALNMEAMSVFNGNRRSVVPGSPEHPRDANSMAKMGGTSCESASSPTQFAGLDPRFLANGSDVTELETSEPAETKTSFVPFDAKPEARGEDGWDPHDPSRLVPSSLYTEGARKVYSHSPTVLRPGGSRNPPALAAAFRPKSHDGVTRQEPQSDPRRIVRQVASAVTVTRHVKPPDPGVLPIRPDPPTATLQRGSLA